MQSILFNARFGPMVRKGIKLHSVRRTTQLVAGDLCDLREIRANGTILLRGNVPVTAVQSIRISLDYPNPILIDGVPIPSAEQFAISDGFANLLDMFAWYQRGGYELPFAGVLIKWAPLPTCIQCGAVDAAHTIRPNRHLYCATCYFDAISLP